jgi:hypothetical protein
VLFSSPLDCLGPGRRVKVKPHAVASRALTRRPQPEGWQLSRSAGVDQGTVISAGRTAVRRAISGPLTPATSGLSRSLADTLLRRSDHVTGPDGTDSQADSAGPELNLHHVGHTRDASHGSIGTVDITPVHKGKTARAVMVCKTVGSAYVGSNPTPATTCGNGPLAGNSRLCGPFSFVPACVTLSRCRPSCCAVHGRMADGRPCC